MNAVIFAIFRKSIVPQTVRPRKTEFLRFLPEGAFLKGKWYKTHDVLP